MVLLFGYHTSTLRPDGRRAATVISARRGPSGSGAAAAAPAPARPRLAAPAAGIEPASGRPSTAAKTVTGAGRRRPSGVRCRCSSRVSGGKITDVDRRCSTRTATAATRRSTHYALPILIQETIDAQSANIDMVSGATVTSDGYLAVAAERASTRPACDRRPSSRAGAYVEHVMGMPVSLALRGRHADDDAGRAAWAGGAGRAAARSTGCSAPTATTRSSPGSAAARSTLADCPPEVAEVLALGAPAERESGGAFEVRRPGPDGRSRCSTPAAW